MVRILFMALFLFTAQLVSAQTSEAEMTTGYLMYKPEIPDTSTYKVTKNTTGFPVPLSILEKINMYRRFDVDYLWVVNGNIEILVYYVNKMVVHPNTNSGK
jgi:hypothetical protein